MTDSPNPAPWRSRAGTLCLATAIASAAAFAASPPVLATVTGHAPQAVASHAAVHVDPRVTAQVAANERPDVIVRFKGRADVDAAFGIKDRDARSTHVYEALKATAENAQSSTLSMLRSQFNLSEQRDDFTVLWAINGIAIRALTPALLDELMRDSFVERIQLDEVIKPMRPEHSELASEYSLAAVESSIAQVKAPDAWAQGWRGQGIVIANIDDGVRHTHNALREQYRGHDNGSYSHDFNWYDPYNKAAAPRQTGWHGSHTMGTIVGDDGADNQIGVAPEAEWIACIGFGGTNGSATDSGLVECGQFMLAPHNTVGDTSTADPTKRPDAVNNSWGDCGRTYDDWYNDVIDNWIASGIMPVFANGNASNCGYSNPPGLNTVGNPARNGKALSIGSTGKNNGSYAPHSNWGPTDNPSPGLPNYPDHGGFADLKPNLSAPGVAIRSASNAGDGVYRNSNGTSMSAPAVTGAIAVMFSAAECLRGDYATIGTMLMQTARPIAYNSGSSSDGPGNIPNQATGWGEVDVLAAAEAANQWCLANSIPYPEKSFTPDVIAESATSTLTITLNNGTDVDAELTADFVDTLPTGLSVVAGSETTDCNGTVSSTSNSITLASGALLAAESICTIEAEIAADAPGVYTNVLPEGALETDAGDSVNAASATLEVYDDSFPNPPSIAASFTPSTIFADETSIATVTLTNNSANPAVLTAPFTNTLPAGLTIDRAETDCFLSIGDNDDRQLFAAATLPVGLTLAANDSCELNITVSPSAPGSYVNTIPMLSLETDQGSNLEPASATLTVNPGFPAPYCDADFPSGVEPITLVDFGGINNRSTAATTAPALEDFRDIVGTVSQGGLYEMIVEGNTNGSFTTQIKVYIDWNQDGVFDASEGYEIGSIQGSTGEDGKQAIADIPVPSGALLGETRMRVTKRFSTAADACNSTGYGQAEDYTLVVNDDPVAPPLANVTPAELDFEAEVGSTDSGVLTVHNEAAGRLEFNVRRALAEQVPPVGQSLSRATYSPLTPMDLDKLAILEQNPAYAAATSVLEQDLAPHTLAPLADDPGCDVNTPGIIVHDHDGTPDNGYGFNTVAGADARLVEKFTPTMYPNAFDTVCIAFISNTGLTSVPVDIVVFDDSGPGGGPGAELGSVSAVADNIAAGLGKQFQSFDISSMGLNITSGSVYIGARWDASVQEGFFVASDESSPESAGGYAYSSDEWDPAGELWPEYRALFIRAVEAESAEPGVGCESPSNVPWLTVSPASGAINGIGSMDVTVTANAANLSAGTHEGWICVDTNDPLNPLFEIPVTFEVTPSDIIFQDGFEGGNPDVVTGMINLPLDKSPDGNTLDFATGNWGVYNPGRVDNINLYDYGDDTLAVYWYGDSSALDVGGVTTGDDEVFAILQSGDTVGPSKPISANSVVMANWNQGADGYLGVAFENSETGELNYGYIHLTTTSPEGFPVQVLEYAFNKAGDAITIP